MFRISAETFAKKCVNNIIDKNEELWLRNMGIQKKK